jgi:hypothetical protein
MRCGVLAELCHDLHEAQGIVFSLQVSMHRPIMCVAATAHEKKVDAELAKV